MSADTNRRYARITPIESRRANRYLGAWSLLREFALTQTLGTLYGFTCCLIPMMAGWWIGSTMGAPVPSVFGLGVAFAMVAAVIALAGLRFYGFPVLGFESRLGRRFMNSVDVRNDPFFCPDSASGARVVELVPVARRRKILCLDTATDLMILRIDAQGVWMMGDRYRYELPAESIVGAYCDGYRPPGCSFEIYMAVVSVRTEEGTIELPISYRDYGWTELRGGCRRAQIEDLVSRVNEVAKGHLYRPPQPPIEVRDNHPARWSLPINPYAAPAVINE